MANSTQQATFSFQAEVKQLLHLMVHSLYSNKEIFLRELISNASDANDKLRFEALAAPALLEDEPDLCITVTLDPDNGVLCVSDNGIGKIAGSPGKGVAALLQLLNGLVTAVIVRVMPESGV